ncbi:amino acid permease [Rhexocercosporidium sp. MPI-PUGE-AT-0058]|nr:amino acid permease [Rhexocercosporidium sp. MPI-PUGE-AT-0058]
MVDMAADHDTGLKTGLDKLEPSNFNSIVGLSDEERLAQLGHTQELNRGFSVLALGSLVLCLMATWEALSTVISSALVSGGPPCLFYNYILSFICTLCIALSLAEIASIYPTAGGQYHWVAAMSPPKSREAASWATGWISVSGQIVLTASAGFAAGLQFQSLIVITDESYDRPRWQGMLFFWAVLVYAAVINTLGIKLLPSVNLAAGVLHITALVGIMITLGVMSDKNSTAFVFTEVVNSSGWSSDGVSWLIGLQSAVYPMLGYDAACHLAEEMPNASRNVPLAMLGGVSINAILGLGYTIMLLYSTSPLSSLLETPTGFPFMQIFLDVTHSKVGTILMSLVPCIIATIGSIAGLASTSRTLWAFARDDGLPFSAYFSHVHPKLHVPVRAIAIVSILQLLLGLLYLGNVTAFNAVLSMAIIGSYLAYCLPIFYMAFFGRPKLDKSHYGPFALPKALGLAVNIVSMIWIVVVVIFSMFPLALPVTAANMNYSSVVLVGWGIFGAIYYFWDGKRRFRAPYQDVWLVAHPM